MAEQKLAVDIAGMHCGACATGIQMVAEGIDGVGKVFVDYDKKHGEINFDPEKVEQEKIIEEIGKLGYTATPTG